MKFPHPPEVDGDGNELIIDIFKETKLYDTLSGEINITAKSAYLRELLNLSEPPLSSDENIAQGRVEI